MVVVAILVLLLNVGISWWNARVCGLSWEDAKRAGGWTRFLTWCGVFQSAVGFSMPILLAEALVGSAAGYPKAANAMLGLWYVAVIVPLLGTGIAITVDSVIQAYRRRDFASVAGAAYNVFATADNAYQASRALPSIFDSLGGFFSSSDDEEGGGIVVMAAVAFAALSLLGGAMVTWGLVRHYRDRRAVAHAHA